MLVGAGVRQGSSLSPYLFSVAMDEVKKETQGDKRHKVPWCMVLADDIIVLCKRKSGRSK